MGRSSVARWAGTASVVGGLLWLWGLPALDPALPPYSHAGGHVILAAAGLSLVLGLLGLRVVDWGRSGALGAGGGAVALAGAALVGLGNALEGLEGRIAWAEYGWGLFLLGILVLAVGATLTGAAHLRTDVLPRWTALALTLAPIAAASVIAATVALQSVGIVPRVDDPPPVVMGLVLVLMACPWLLLGGALWASGQPAVVSGGEGR
jgi:hypothetical protein